jgi:hypothetical protein
MAEEITFLALIGRGIAVITSYFSDYINSYIIESNTDFEILIIVAEALILWMIIKKIAIKIVDMIWTFKKYELWKKVIFSSFGFISLTLILLLFRVFFNKLAETRQDVNLNVLESICTLYTVILMIYLVYYKVEKYSKIE